MVSFDNRAGQALITQRTDTDLVTERVDRYTKRPRQPKVTDLQFTTLVDQQVLRLEISMQHTVVMAVRDTLR